MTNLKSNYQNKAVCLVIENIANLLFLSTKSNSNKNYNSLNILSAICQSYPQFRRVDILNIKNFTLFKNSNPLHNRLFTKLSQSCPQFRRVVRNFAELSAISQSSIGRVVRNFAELTPELAELVLQHTDFIRNLYTLKLLNSKFIYIDINPRGICDE
jgi:hypothetical protein